MTEKYYLEHLGCANCAAKMEAKINALEGVESASISFPTKQLHVTAKNPDDYIDEIQKICASIENEVIVTKKNSSHSHTHSHHHHEEHCGCGHDHEHHHHDEYCGCEHDYQYNHEYIHHHEEHSHAKKISDHHKISLRSLNKKTQSFLLGVILVIAAAVIDFYTNDPNMVLIAYLIAYLCLANDIIRTAVNHIGKGQLFDENFLMSLATVGAFFIGEYQEAIGVILFYRIGEAFEEYAVEKSRSSIMETVNMRPETILKVHGNHTHEIPAQDAMPEDIILIRPGDRVPLDSVVLEGTSQIDTSALTGEPVPVTVHEGEELLSGCLNQTGVLKLKVTKGLDESMVSRIMESMENAAASKPKIDRFITRFARIYTPIVVLIAALTAIIPSLLTGNWQHWTYTAFSFLVISCPCALVLSVPLAFFSGIGLGSKRGILFKGGASLEVLKDVKAVIMDKTGTITEGNFNLQTVISYHDYSEDLLLAYAAACEANSTHPIAKSILAAAAKKKIGIPEVSSIEEIAGHGIKALISGKEMLCGNEKLMKKYQISLPSTEYAYGTEIYLAIDGILEGQFIISDTLKSDSAPSIKQLDQSSIHTVMLTGDSKESAKSIADATGIHEYYAKLLPDDKLNVLQALREKYGSVMFVGDGINDAPVLAGADCGAAMGSGADAAIEAADVVFMTSRLSAVPEAIKIAKETNRIAVENIVFALAIKAAVILLGILGFASMWMAVFADTGVAVICIFNSIRILRK